MTKIDITLTEFIDFLIRTGSSKQTKLKTIKKLREQDYELYFDFYKPLREAIQEFHRNKKPKQFLKELLQNIKDDKKLKNYPAKIENYIRFLGRKNINYFSVPSGHWVDDTGELRVSLKPELGLEINDTSYLVKLYFKEEPLTKEKADLILTLMTKMRTKNPLPSGLQFMIVDLNRGKVFTTEKLKIDLTPVLNGEASCFISMWNGGHKRSA